MTQKADSAPMTVREAMEHFEYLYEARKKDRDDYGRGLADAYWVALETLRAVNERRT